MRMFCLLMVASLALAGSKQAAAADSLTVHPQHVELTAQSRSQQIAVTLPQDTGARDVTQSVRFTVGDPQVASITPSGKIKGHRNGETTLRIEHEGASVQIPIRVGGVDEPPRYSYRQDVMPILSKTGCNQGTCHGSLTGKGGFRLSLRGDDPIFDREMMTRDSLGRRVDRNDPARSLLLLKPAGVLPHGGGKRFSVGSPEFTALKEWIAGGALDDGGSIVEVTRLDIFPSRQVLQPGCLRQQLVVTAHLEDGSQRDVTSLVCYETDTPTGVSVTEDGLVQVDGPMEVVVSVRFNEARAIGRLVFLPDRPEFQWRPQPSANFIDDLVHQKLQTLQIHPSEIADDATFLRRAYLATIGILPTVEETKAFLASTDDEKRTNLIDELVERPEFADFWALKWADVLRNEQKTMGIKGVWAFRRWLVRQIDRDVPFKQIAHDILSGNGATYTNPAAGFYRTNREPDVAAEAVAQVFLGYRLQCAKCHNHPFDIWKQDDYYGLAAYFSSLERKKLTNIRRDRFDKHEVNGDEIIYLHGKAQIRQPVRNVVMSPAPLTQEETVVPPAGPPLENLADWVTADRQFARNVANRVWFHLMGKGIVDAPDDFRISNPPSNPELLEALTDCFIDGEYRLKPLVATIVKSTTFQRSAVPNETNSNDDRNFSRYPVRLASAEVLLDAVCQFLEVPERFRDAPAGMRAVQLPGVHADHPFMKVFGKPVRLITCECERSNDTTLSQAFQLINGQLVREKLEAKDGRLSRLLKSGQSPADLTTELYLAALCRLPNPVELQAAVAHLEAAADRRAAVEDLAWALLNSKEFLLIR